MNGQMSKQARLEARTPKQAFFPLDLAAFGAQFKFPWLKVASPIHTHAHTHTGILSSSTGAI